MSEQKIQMVDFDEFQAVADNFIERSSQTYGEMPASAFFELLSEKMAERVTETIELEVDIVNNRLVLQPPVGAVRVKRNEVLIGNQRIVVKLKSDAVYPTAH